MRTFLVSIISALILWSPLCAAPADQPSDTIRASRFQSKQLILPAALVAWGAFGINNGWWHRVNDDTRKWMADLHGNHPCRADDYLRFVPSAVHLGLGILNAKAKHNLKGAPIVVAGGYGMGSKEGFDMLFELAKELHAEVGASRAAVDAGFADHDRQIGQTGITVRPKLYIACGISGQIQHIAGMQESSIIISINNDPNAPINTIADYVINGTVEEVIPKMIKYYKSHSK